MTAIVLLLLFGTAGAVYYITTNNGTLQIRTSAADVEVVVRQNGEIIEIIDTKTDSHIVRLPTGKYEVELRGNNEFKVSKDQFVLRRGENVIVDVKHVAQGPWAQPDKRQNVLLRDFAPTLETITEDGVASEQGGWRIDVKQDRSVRLFEQPLANIDDGMLFYRAKLKTKDLTGRAYLEMWVRLPGKQEYFSKGLHNAVSGTSDWTEYEIPFKLAPGQYPDLVKLNLNVEGTGTVWIKDVELHASTSAKNIGALKKAKTESPNGLAETETQKQDLAGLQYVTRDYMAAVVINPQRILNKPMSHTAKLYLSQLFKSDLGVEMKDLEQVVLLVPADSPTKNRRAAFELAAIIRLHSLVKVDANEVVDRILEHPQRVTDGPYVFYVDDRGNGAFVADNRTIVRAPRSLLLRMAASRQPQGILAETLRDANLSSDVIGVIVNTGLARQSLYVAAATARSQLPPELAEQLSRAPDTILSATVAMDLSPGAPISLTVKATNDDAAEMLTRLGQAGLVETRARLTELGATRIPTTTIEPDELGLRTAFELIGTATAVQKGDQVVVSSKTPSGLADAVMSSVIMRAKQSALDAQRRNQLKQLGIAMHNYHDTYKNFPPAKDVPDDQFDKNGTPLLSWRVHVLPYINEEAAQLYQKFRLNEPWNSEHNLALLDQMPNVFKTADSPTKTTMLAVVGPGAIYEGKRGAAIQDATDGTANTILAVLAGDDKAVPWTKPEDLPLVEDDPITALGEIAGEEFQAVFCDGSVQPLHKEIDPESLKAMLIRNDGKIPDRNKRRPKRPATASPRKSP